LAKQRMVNTKFWDDGYIRTLEPHGKLLFLYLFTGPLATISGAYEITIDHAHFHTGIERDEIGIWLAKFRTDDKATFQDGWLLVHNTIDHQTLTSPKIVAGIEESIKGCPDWIKHTLSIRYQRLSHLNPNLNSNSNLNTKTVAAIAAEDDTPVERRIWKDGIELLAKSGLTESKARPLLGRLARDYGKIELAQAIAATQAENSVDPKPFLIAVLLKRSGATDRVKLQVGKSNGGAPYTPDPPCDICGKEICFALHAEERRSAA
jgi:hypothetical protein